uniref:Ymf66 n=1 Tax=Tetrahymena rostrata TaxID=5909 RepID=A0A6G5NK82_TETRO|nr:Ymf66 [Tetrahymena rostrata]QBI37916.1 Ymf66 [Tetrahymena rostrata]URP31105.1 Ymf66 [Tetrahymena rostrata]
MKLMVLDKPFILEIPTHMPFPWLDGSFKSTDESYISIIVFDSIDWIYSTSESILFYDYKIWYLWEGLSNYNEFDLFFNQYWTLSLSTSFFQLFYSVILDKYMNVLVQNNPFNAEWFRFVLHTKENALIWLYHPELAWHVSSFNQFFTYFYGGIFEFVYFDKSNPDICIIAHTLYLHLIILFFLFTSFVLFLFSFYNNANTEENTIDSDYLTVSGTVEAEKEITSIDDYLGLVFIVSYVFGVFFYIHAWTTIVEKSALLMSYYSIFIMFIFVLGMPTLILYDLGIFFLAYLKGAGKNTNSLVEVIFDYIACIVFYTRILAQWVRIVLMLITFLSLSHYVAEFEITNNVLMGNENQSDNMNELNSNHSTTYYILTVLPGKFIYWIYEILHTLFLVSSQFIAFFAIVFWLFLFLYTFFIIEKHEDFFSKKREERKKKLISILNLK